MSLKYILLLLLVAVVVYLAYYALQVYRHIGMSLALVAAAKPYEVERGVGAPTLLVVGDSTAVGVGAATPNETTAGYFAQEHPQWSVTNLAVSGARVADVLAQVRTASSTYTAVLVQAGGNDTIRFTNLKQLRANYAALLQEAKQRSPKVVALSSGNVGQAPLFNFFPLAMVYEARTRATRAIFKDEAAKAGVTYVDLFKEHGEPDEISAHPALHYAPDGIHLSSAGWRVWYQDIKNAFSDMQVR
jgi:lysophospholipase L1-like esterase